MNHARLWVGCCRVVAARHQPGLMGKERPEEGGEAAGDSLDPVLPLTVVARLHARGAVRAAGKQNRTVAALKITISGVLSAHVKILEI